MALSGLSICQTAPSYVDCFHCAGTAAGSNGHAVAPGQALLRQLQMSRSLSSPQQAQHHQTWLDQPNTAAPASGWDAYPAQSASPFFDPAIVNASSAALREAGMPSTCCLLAIFLAAVKSSGIFLASHVLQRKVLTELFMSLHLHKSCPRVSAMYKTL